MTKWKGSACIPIEMKKEKKKIFSYLFFTQCVMLFIYYIMCICFFRACDHFVKQNLTRLIQKIFVKILIYFKFVNSLSQTFFKISNISVLLGRFFDSRIFLYDY